MIFYAIRKHVLSPYCKKFEKTKRYISQPMYLLYNQLYSLIFVVYLLVFKFIIYQAIYILVFCQKIKCYVMLYVLQ